MSPAAAGSCFRPKHSDKPNLRYQSSAKQQAKRNLATSWCRDANILQLKTQIFFSGVGGDQPERKEEWLLDISFDKYLETWLQIQANVVLEAWFQTSELLSTCECFSDSNTSGVVPIYSFAGWRNLRADHKFADTIKNEDVIFLCQSQNNSDTKMATNVE